MCSCLGGSIEPEALVKALKDNDFSQIPEWMKKPLQEAQQLLLKTRDGQLCDVLLDKTALDAILQAERILTVPCSKNTPSCLWRRRI